MCFSVSEYKHKELIMLRSFKKIALGTALLAASASSFAALPFTVDASSNGTGFAGAQFQADEIAGTYAEVVEVTGAGTFEATVLLDFTSFVFQGGTSGLKPGNTGLGISYQLYALVDFDGLVTAGAPDFKTGGWTGSIEMYLDPQFDSPSGDANSLTDIDSTVASIGDTSNDLLLFDATIDFGQSNGTDDSGSFSLNGSLSDDPDTDPSLTAAGEAFFVEPDPFYNLSLIHI